MNINRKSDTRGRHVIALYTQEDCFAIQFENDGELETWLNLLLSLAAEGGGSGNLHTIKPKYGKLGPPPEHGHRTETRLFFTRKNIN